MTLETLIKEWQAWWLEGKELRFGQYVFNKHFEGTWPELFYEEDDDKAFAMLVERICNED